MGQIISINATTVLDYVESVLNISLIQSVIQTMNFYWGYVLGLC